MLPYVDINLGDIVCRFKDKRFRFCRAANKKNARLLGRKLRAMGCQTWLFSSSVDFPEEYGAPKLDYRALIEEGYAAEPKEGFNAG